MPDEQLEKLSLIHDTLKDVRSSVNVVVILLIVIALKLFNVL